jgi:tripartite-type tricarboxylate transporter receptor subunit TctC
MHYGFISSLHRVLIAASTALALAAPAAHAADVFPSKPIRLVVPYPPGGGNDVLARVIVQKLSDELKQQVYIDNRAGAGGTIGTALVAQAAPDGYTILIINTLPHTSSAGMYSSLPYDPVKSFVSIGEIATTSYMLAINPKVPATTAKEFIDLAIAKPDSLFYGSAGNGSATHLAAELFKSVTKAPITHVPYKGGGLSLSDLLAGQVQATFENVAALTPYIQAGTLRGLVITGPKRVALFPTLPTMAESGYAGFDVSGKFGLVAPAGTPAAMLTTLNKALNRTLADPEIVKKLVALGADPMPSTPAEYDELIKKESAIWLKVVRDQHIKND